MALGIRVQEILSIFVLHYNPYKLLRTKRIERHRPTDRIIILARRGKNREHAKEYRVYPISKIMFHDDWFRLTWVIRKSNDRYSFLQILFKISMDIYGYLWRIFYRISRWDGQKTRRSTTEAWMLNELPYRSSFRRLFIAAHLWRRDGETQARSLTSVNSLRPRPAVPKICTTLKSRQPSGRL